ncbi:hypothetical protein [Methanobrevibacter sp.]|uniref:hypothetical protein n=1 Tax=Methanobrevibacter sp. TaxID=66852 RepID=UPI003D7CDDEE
MKCKPELYINAQLNELAKVTYYSEASEILNNLYYYYSEDFNENQLTELCNIALTNYQVYTCHSCKNNLRNILSENKNKIDEELYEKTIQTTEPESYINAQLNNLAKVTCDDHAEKILNQLHHHYSDDFSKTQLTQLCNIALTNDQVYTCHSCKNNLRNILLKNKYKIDEELYEKTIQTTEPEALINAQLNYLKEISFGYSKTKLILDNLYYYYSDNFSETQLTQLCNIALTNDQVYNCDYCKSSLRSILLNNKYKIDKELYKKTIQITEPEAMINAQLNNLAKVTYDYREARLILNELYHYSTDFTKTQLTQLCNIALTNDQVYNCDYCKSSLRGILSENKDKIDKELYEKTILKNKL